MASFLRIFMPCNQNIFVYVYVYASAWYLVAYKDVFGPTPVAYKVVFGVLRLFLHKKCFKVIPSKQTEYLKFSKTWSNW